MYLAWPRTLARPSLRMGEAPMMEVCLGIATVGLRLWVFREDSTKWGRVPRGVCGLSARGVAATLILTRGCPYA